MIGETITFQTLLENVPLLGILVYFLLKSEITIHYPIRGKGKCIISTLKEKK